MEYCFDTSGINRLHDDPEKAAIINGLLTVNTVRISALNVIEAVATRDQERRISLIRLQQQLAEGYRPLRIPTELLRELTLGRLRGLPSITLTIDGTGAGVWWALQRPDELDEQARQEAYEWKKSLEKKFSDTHQSGRQKIREAFKNEPVPHTAGKLIQLLCREPRSFFSTASDLYRDITNTPLDLEAMRQLFNEVREWPLYLAGWAQGMFARALQDSNYGVKTNAGTIDLWFAVYLNHCDFLVTDDLLQYKALRVINALSGRHPRAHVLTYDAFRTRLVLP